MDQSNKAKIVVQLLEKRFGIPEPKHHLNPLDNLILTILSQNTNDKNRDVAYTRLREKLPTWNDVKNADVEVIKEAIKSAGLENQKSLRIKHILQWIDETFGSLNIDFLCQMEPQKAFDLFCSQKGIGVKTMAVVLCFSCDVDIFPVDTHVHRICRRLGLVSEKATAEKTFWLIKDQVPKGKSYSFHINLLKLGRTICSARSPNCSVCPLIEQCDYYRKLLKFNESK